MDKSISSRRWSFGFLCLRLPALAPTMSVEKGEHKMKKAMRFFASVALVAAVLGGISMPSRAQAPPPNTVHYVMTNDDNPGTDTRNDANPCSGANTATIFTARGGA